MWIVILIVIIVLILLKDSKNSSNNHYGSSYSPKRSYRTFKPKQSYQPKKSAEVKGIEGEKNVRKIIGDTVIGQKYVFNDYVILDNGKTTQIDHIVVTVCGVFVIETKNYSGMIFGSEDQQEWTQVLAGGKEKHKLYNPLKQNATHIYYLKKILGNVPIRSVVVFVQGNTQFLQTDKVVSLSDLNKLLYFGEQVLNANQVSSIGEKLKLNNSRGVVSNQTHINNIKEQKTKIGNNICPRCNAKLVLRKGKYGEFWGCSNYPECTFIKKQ